MFRAGAQSVVSRRLQEQVYQPTFTISVREHSGSLVAMGRILIFCALEILLASGSVIFLWVALSME